jgi:hypothetical protein
MTIIFIRYCNQLYFSWIIYKILNFPATEIVEQMWKNCGFGGKLWKFIVISFTIILL